MKPTPEQLKQAATIICQVSKTTDQIIYEVAVIIAERDQLKEFNSIN